MAEKPSWKRTIEHVRAGDLRIDRQVQRDVHPAHVRTLARDWDDLLVGTLTGWRKDDGHIYLLDGQQRTAAKVGGPRLTGVVKDPDPDYMFMVETYEGITEAQAAGIFLGLNRGRKAVDAFARWWVEKTAGEDIALAMERAASRCGLEVSTHSNAREIGCVSTMRRVIARRGPSLQNEDALVWAINMYRGAWGTTPAWRAEVIEALALFKLKYDGKIDDTDALKKFGSQKVETWMGWARAMSVGNNRVVGALLTKFQQEYDYGRRGHTRLEPRAA